MRPFFPVLLSVLLFLLNGCGGSAGSSQEKPQSGSRDPILEKYESSFRPSDYDPDIDLITKADSENKQEEPVSSLLIPAQPETTQGFRIQVILTQDIEQASRIRDDLMKSIGNNAVYIVYDLPYYKVRIGNFTEREDAAESIRKLTGMGYKDAWVVPDKIIRITTDLPAATDSTKKQ